MAYSEREREFTSAKNVRRSTINILLKGIFKNVKHFSLHAVRNGGDTAGRDMEIINCHCQPM